MVRLQFRRARSTPPDRRAEAARLVETLRLLRRDRRNSRRRRESRLVRKWYELNENSHARNIDAVWNRALQRSLTNDRLGLVSNRSFAHDSHSRLAVGCLKFRFVEVPLAPARHTDQPHKARPQLGISPESASLHSDADFACRGGYGCAGT